MPVGLLLKKKITEYALTQATLATEWKYLNFEEVRATLIPGAAVSDAELEEFLTFLCLHSQELEYSNDPMVRGVSWVGNAQKQAMKKMAGIAANIKAGFSYSGVPDDVNMRKQKKEVDESQWVPTGKKDSSRHAISKCVKCGTEASRINQKQNHKCS